jgi:hypothetical protein
MVTKINDNIIRFKIDNTDVFIEDLGEGKGKLSITNTYGHNYSYYWGAMGSNITEFILRINSEYFADKLLGYQSCYTFCPKQTFSNLRKYIKDEMCLNWYEHMEFQSEMRVSINEFQSECDSADHFVYGFNTFVDSLPYYLIDCRFDRDSVKSSFKNISEPWHFIGDKPSENYKWLLGLHKKISKVIKKYNKSLVV